MLIGASDRNYKIRTCGTVLCMRVTNIIRYVPVELRVYVYVRMSDYVLTFCPETATCEPTD